jgi:hypothetical protein
MYELECCPHVVVASLELLHEAIERASKFLQTSRNYRDAEAGANTMTHAAENAADLSHDCNSLLEQRDRFCALWRRLKYGAYQIIRTALFRGVESGVRYRYSCF